MLGRDRRRFRFEFFVGLFLALQKLRVHRRLAGFGGRIRGIGWRRGARIRLRLDLRSFWPFGRILQTLLVRAGDL